MPHCADMKIFFNRIIEFDHILLIIWRRNRRRRRKRRIKEEEQEEELKKKKGILRKVERKTKIQQRSRRGGDKW